MTDDKWFAAMFKVSPAGGDKQGEHSIIFYSDRRDLRDVKGDAEKIVLEKYLKYERDSLKVAPLKDCIICDGVAELVRTEAEIAQENALKSLGEEKAATA